MNRELLDKPFRPDQIKQRKSEYGDGVLDYLEGATVIQRLNEAFAAEWSFEIIEHLIQEKEVLVSGRLTANGFTKTQFGNKLRESSVGDDLKAAATDCIKKCATQFGIGLHLYLDEKTLVAAVPASKPNSSYPLPTPNPPNAPRAESAPENGNSDGRLSNKQLAAIFAIAKGRGFSQKETREYTQELFGKVPDFLSKREASTCIDKLKGGQR